MPARVAIAMSGGVDSSTAAALLKSRGYDVVGFSMQLWDQRRNPGGDGSGLGRCCSLEDFYDARAVAAVLEVPYYVVNFRQEFEMTVIHNFVESYRNGYTPSPCVRCNSSMKFEHLMKVAEEDRASHVATGHYARTVRDEETGRYLLLKGRDPEKDQSYFLFELSQDQLAKAIFPIGDLKKAEVRQMARKLGLNVAEKPESQEICFVPDGDYAGFIERQSGDLSNSAEMSDHFPTGDIVDTQGRVLGKHRGIHHFTIGQRRGLGISHSVPLYVVDIIPQERTVVVGERSRLEASSCRVVRPNWIAIPELTRPMHASVKIRSRHPEALATLTPCGDQSVRIDFDTPQMAVAPGQAPVFYEGERVIGGGWLERRFNRPVP